MLIMKKIYTALIALGCLGYACSAQEEKTINTLENYKPKLKYGSFSGQPVEYIADSDTVYLTLRGKNGDLKNLWSILSEGATPQQYAQIIRSEHTDVDPSESHKIFHVSYVDVNGTNYLLMLAGQIGDIRYAERLIDFKLYKPTLGDK